MFAPSLLALVASLNPQSTSDVGTSLTTTGPRTEIALLGRPFTTLHTDQSRPVLWPLVDGSGRALTRAWPMQQDARDDATDHVHQRSLFFAHGDVNGVDFWTETPHSGRIEVATFERQIVRADSAELRLRCRWLQPGGKTLCTDTRDLAFFVAGGLRSLDYTVALHASEVALTLGDTKEGTMAARVARGLCFDKPDSTGHALSSEGLRDTAVWGKRARWVAYDGVVDGVRVGLALFDHPQNLRHPTTWHARPYGLLAANPFGLHDFEGASAGAGAVQLPRSETLTLRYRFVLFAGAADAAVLDAHWRAFAAGERAPRPAPPATTDRREQTDKREQADKR